jgi:hypothetical protein
MALLFLLPTERSYIDLLYSKYNVIATETKQKALTRSLFPGRDSEDQAHHLALHFEHVVMENEEVR